MITAVLQQEKPTHGHLISRHHVIRISPSLANIKVLCPMENSIFRISMKRSSCKGNICFSTNKLGIRVQARVSFLIVFQYDLLKPVICEL